MANLAIFYSFAPIFILRIAQYSCFLQHLHMHQPKNLGFDVRGDIRLFDFGLAKELQESERIGGVHGSTYKMSGNTGSLRYMSPEVALSKPYNLTADVYSFGTMLWEMLSLSKPYDGFNRNMHAEMVVSQGIRPSIPMSWPFELRNMVERSWSADISQRPTMEQCYNILRRLVIELRGGDEEGLNHSRRRSTFIMPGTAKKASPKTKRGHGSHSASGSSQASRPSVASLRNRMSVVAHRKHLSTAAAAAQAAKELDGLNHEMDTNDFVVSKSRARGLGLAEENPEVSQASIHVPEDDEEMEDVEPGKGYEPS